MTERTTIPPALPTGAKPKTGRRWLKILIGVTGAAWLVLAALGSYNSVDCGETCSTPRKTEGS
jgi:hypothetical protein